MITDKDNEDLKDTSIEEKKDTNKEENQEWLNTSCEYKQGELFEEYCESCQ